MFNRFIKCIKSSRCIKFILLFSLVLIVFDSIFFYRDYNRDVAERYVRNNQVVKDTVGSVDYVNFHDKVESYNKSTSRPYVRYRFIVGGNTGKALVEIYLEYSEIDGSMALIKVNSIEKK